MNKVKHPYPSGSKVRINETAKETYVRSSEYNEGSWWYVLQHSQELIKEDKIVFIYPVEELIAKLRTEHCKGCIETLIPNREQYIEDHLRDDPNHDLESSEEEERRYWNEDYASYFLNEVLKEDIPKDRSNWARIEQRLWIGNDPKNIRNYCKDCFCHHVWHNKEKEFDGYPEFLEGYKLLYYMDMKDDDPSENKSDVEDFFLCGRCKLRGYKGINPQWFKNTGLCHLCCYK